MNRVVWLNAAVVEAGQKPWQYYFTGLAWGQSAFGVIRRER